MIGGAFIFIFGVIIYFFFVSGFHFIGSAFFFLFCLLKGPCYIKIPIFRYALKTTNKGFEKRFPVYPLVSFSFAVATSDFDILDLYYNSQVSSVPMEK